MQALLIDDNPSVISVVERMLVDAGYETTTALNFDGAAAELRATAADVVVVDIRLGEFNGLQLAMLARRRRADARIVVISGWDDPVLRAQAADCTAAYLMKPFTSAQLLDAIRTSDGAGTRHSAAS